MGELNAIFERFQAKKIKEFRNGNFNTCIEHVKDTMLHKEWYNVIWCNVPDSNALMHKILKSSYAIKSKSYKNQKDAIKHFNEIIKSQIKND